MHTGGGGCAGLEVPQIIWTFWGIVLFSGWKHQHPVRIVCKMGEMENFHVKPGKCLSRHKCTNGSQVSDQMKFLKLLVLLRS